MWGQTGNSTEIKSWSWSSGELYLLRSNEVISRKMQWIQQKYFKNTILKKFKRAKMEFIVIH